MFWPQNGVVADAGDKANDAWVAVMQEFVFTDIGRAGKLRSHAPTVVTPVVVSAGGGMLDASDEIFPAPTSRSTTSARPSAWCCSRTCSSSQRNSRLETAPAVVTE